MDRPDAIAVRAYPMGLQDRICAALEAHEGRARFREDRFEDPFAPTSHANFRFFLTEAPNAAPPERDEAQLVERYLTPRDWMGIGEN